MSGPEPLRAAIERALEPVYATAETRATLAAWIARQPAGVRRELARAIYPPGEGPGEGRPAGGRAAVAVAQGAR